MPKPLYFMPDMGIQDADVLGYGDLFFDDGSSQFINGDPEIAELYPQNDVAAPVDLGAGLGPDMGDEDPLSGVQMPDFEQPQTEVPVGDTGAMVDISTGALRQGTTEVEHIGREPQQQPQTVVPVGDSGAMVDISTGEIKPPGSAPPAGPPAGYGTGGLQLARRDDALPPAIAQQQASQLEAQQQQQYQAAEQARQQEAQITRDAALKRQGELQAEQAELQRQQAEQQAKIARYQQEQKELADMDIKTDLVTSQGAVGAVFSILGAAMLGAVGSTEGLRMIDQSIDASIKKQVNQRDTKLHLLAERVSSTQQAMAAGKAQLYKILADKVETTQKLTQADVYEAQTPSILAELQSKQLHYEQEQERISLGKTTEVAPVAAKPSALSVRSTQAYGKAAASQEADENEIMRAARQLGLDGWDPEKGQFANRDKVLGEGISGVGRADSLMSRLGRLPLVGEVPKALDEAVTSDRGLANRATMEALANAEAKRQNPGRAPTDADRESAKVSLGTLSEAGAVEAIERLLTWQETQRAQDEAIYGQEAAATYQGQREATGVRRSQVQGGAQHERLEPGRAREQLQQYQGGQRQGTTTVDGRPEEVPPEQRMTETSDYVIGIAGRELPPEGIEILMAQAGHETADGQSAPGNNMFGHKSSGRSRAAGRGAAEYSTTEGEGAGARKVRQSFAQYGSVGESVTDHVDLLKRRYPEAWRALQDGDPAGYVAALKDGGYFTGNETTYLNGILGRLQTKQAELDSSMDPSL